MAASGKKKGKKGVTISLNSFLTSDGGSGTGGSGGGHGSSPASSRGSYQPPHKTSNWAEEMDDHDDGDDGHSYGTPMKNLMRSQLPTAPRAARDPDIDMASIPSNPPFKAYLGNLPYDITSEDIEHFFGKLRVLDVSLPQDMGRQKGFGYAEFEDKQSLVDALSMNDELLRNRKIRIDLAAQTQERDGFRNRGSRSDGGDPDRTSGDWRKKDDSQPSFDSRRDDDRGFDRRDDRDRDASRWGPPRGGDRFDDRAGGGFNDRRGFDDRDGGRRGFGSGFRDDRGPRENRYEPPRDRGGYDRYDGGRNDGPPRDGGRSDGPPRDYERRPDYSSSDSAKERPRLNLQKRTKPVEDNAKPTDRSSSIFGGAKPVDTAAKEREIEERLRRERDQERRQVEEEKENRERVSSTTSQRSRKESSGSQDGSSSNRRERKLSSSSSGKGIRTVAPPPGSGSARVRRDSTLSDDEDVFHEGAKSMSPPKHMSPPNKPTSPPATQSPPKSKDDKTLVPAPPPKENPWEKRKSSSDEVPRTVEPVREQEEPVESAEPTSDSTSPPSKKECSKSKEFVPAQPPKENIWEKRKQHDVKKPDEGNANTRGAPFDPKSPWGGNRGGAPSPAPAKDSADGKRGKRERLIPQSVDEMPKYEENQSRDFSDANKFSHLMDEEENGGNNTSD